MEKDLEAKLRKKVQKKEGVALKWNSSIKGAPDRIVLMPKGKIYFVEMKYGRGGRISVQQKFVQNMLVGFGFKVFNIFNDEQLNEFIAEICKKE